LNPASNKNYILHKLLLLSNEYIFFGDKTFNKTV